MKLNIFTVIILGLTSAANACPVGQENFPTFNTPKPVIPIYVGSDCSLGEWRTHRRKLIPIRNQINEFDEQRLQHDYEVRQFDRQLELSAASGQCVTPEYDLLKSLVKSANRSNSGPRKRVWKTLQISLNTSLLYASRNIAALEIDKNRQCGND